MTTLKLPGQRPLPSLPVQAPPEGFPQEEEPDGACRNLPEAKTQGKQGGEQLPRSYLHHLR